MIPLRNLTDILLNIFFIRIMIIWCLGFWYENIKNEIYINQENFGTKNGTKSRQLLNALLLYMYKYCIELVKLGCRELLSTSNNHITIPQQKAANRKCPYFL